MRLRTKVTLVFGLIALVATVVLTVVTYAFARSSLLDQRIDVARSQAVANAARVRDQLRFADVDSVARLLRQRPDPHRGGRVRVHAPLGRPRVTSPRPTRVSPTPRSRSSCATSRPRGESGTQIFEIDGRAPRRCRHQHRRVRQDLLRGLRAAPDRAQPQLDPPRSRDGLDRHRPARRRRRLVDEPPPAAPARSHHRRRRRDRRRQPRHPRRARGRSRPRPAGRVVQRDGRRRAGPHRARGPLRLRRQPRAALADHRARRRRRGHQRPPGRAPGPHPAGARRRRRPGAALRRDGHRPARAVAHRRRRHRPPHRGGRPSSLCAGASPPATASPTCRSTSTAVRPTTVVLDKLRFERIVANLLENAEHHGGGPVRIVDRARRRARTR